jgi:hypothetical protein
MGETRKKNEKTSDKKKRERALFNITLGISNIFDFCNRI